MIFVKPRQVRFVERQEKAKEKQERQELMDSLRWEPERYPWSVV